MIKKIILILVLLTSFQITIHGQTLDVKTKSLMIPLKEIAQLSQDYLLDKDLIDINTNEATTIIYSEEDINRIIETNRTGNHSIKVYVQLENQHLITSIRVLVHEGTELKSGSYPIRLNFKDEVFTGQKVARLVLVSSRAVFSENGEYVLDAYDVFVTENQLMEMIREDILESSIIDLSAVRLFAVNNNQSKTDIMVNTTLVNSTVIGVYPIKLHVTVDTQPLVMYINLHVIEDSKIAISNKADNVIYFIEDYNSVKIEYWSSKWVKIAAFVGILAVPLLVMLLQTRKINKLIATTREVVEVKE